jgi:hypothetical protein
MLRRRYNEEYKRWVAWWWGIELTADSVEGFATLMLLISHHVSSASFSSQRDGAS